MFWEDCESIAITSYLLVIMVFDSYKKTKKIDIANLKRAVQEDKLAGIPKDLSQKEPVLLNDVENLNQFFNSPSDLKRLRDVLNVMISQKQPSSNLGANTLNSNNGNIENLQIDQRSQQIGDQSEREAGDGDYAVL